MALILEDGTNVPDANSFVDLEDIRAYAEARGRSVPADDDALEQLAIRAMDYIQSRRGEFQGSRTYEDQLLPFPRTDVSIDGVDIAIDDIPIEVTNLQCGIIVELAAGLNLFPTALERPLKRSKTGPLEKEWFDASVSPIVTSIDALIAPLIGRETGFALSVRRV